MNAGNLLQLWASAAGLVVCMTSVAWPEDWAQWRGPRRDGISIEKIDPQFIAAGQGKPAWKFDVGVGFSSVAVAEGRVITAGNVDGKDTIFCLDADTGKATWKQSYESEVWPYLYPGGPNCTPLIEVSADAVYFVGRHGDMFCIGLQDGQIRWQRDIHKELGFAKPSWGFTSTPYLFGDTIIINAGTHSAAFDKKTGKEVWTTGTEDAGYAPAAVYQGDVEFIVMFGSKSLAALDPSNGKIHWTIPWETSHKVNASDPLFVGDTLFVSSAYGFGCAAFDVSGKTPKELWRGKQLKAHFTPAVEIGGHIYGVDGNDGNNTWLKCIRLNNGEEKWSALRGLGPCGFTATMEHLLVLTEAGELVVVKVGPEKFEELSRVTIKELTEEAAPKGRKAMCWTPPVLANGKLYCRNAAGVLVCLKVAK